ncbi:hypothetical protein AMELA_G00032840 [Ameiurus melas]|uniref:Uncharacterized protein n=1 Tax=Ameiurus melas TaxID=219545 RepID=A0A7J6B7Z4_AMEME|nr:hypothetical protein AMELA_G00032840 [Ameiurus melas]
MAKLGTDWVKVSSDFPENDVCLINPQWDDRVNARYRAQITALQQRLTYTFPVRLNMTKIAECKQQDAETVSQYLSRLTEIHDTNSGLEKPDALADGQAAITAWEAQLRNSFMKGTTPEIAAIVKQQCIAWDSGNLTQVERYAIHVEKLLGDAKDRKTQKRGKDLNTATITMLQAVSVQRKRSDIVRKTKRTRTRKARWQPPYIQLHVLSAEKLDILQETVQSRSRLMGRGREG